MRTKKTHQNRAKPASTIGKYIRESKPYFNFRWVGDRDSSLCPSCRRKMWRHGYYWRKREGVLVRVYWCRFCRKSVREPEIKADVQGVTCLKCGHKMWKNGSYFRKRDKRLVLKYRCPVCGSTVVDKPLVTKGDKSTKINLDLDRSHN